MNPPNPPNDGNPEFPTSRTRAEARLLAQMNQNTQPTQRSYSQVIIPFFWPPQPLQPPQSQNQNPPGPPPQTQNPPPGYPTQTTDPSPNFDQVANQIYDLMVGSDPTRGDDPNIYRQRDDVPAGVASGSGTGIGGGGGGVGGGVSSRAQRAAQRAAGRGDGFQSLSPPAAPNFGVGSAGEGMRLQGVVGYGGTPDRSPESRRQDLRDANDRDVDMIGDASGDASQGTGTERPRRRVFPGGKEFTGGAVLSAFRNRSGRIGASGSGSAPGSGSGSGSGSGFGSGSTPASDFAPGSSNPTSGFISDDAPFSARFSSRFGSGGVGASGSGSGSGPGPGPASGSGSGGATGGGVPGLNENLAENQAHYQAAILASIRQSQQPRNDAAVTGVGPGRPYGDTQYFTDENGQRGLVIPAEWQEFFAAHADGTVAYASNLVNDESVIYTMRPVDWVRRLLAAVRALSPEERAGSWQTSFGTQLSPEWADLFGRDLNMLAAAQWIELLGLIANGEGPDTVAEWHDQVVAGTWVQGQPAAQGQGPAADDDDDEDDIYGALPPRPRGVTGSNLPNNPPTGAPRNPLAPVLYRQAGTTLSLMASHEAPFQTGTLGDYPEYWGKYDDDGPPKINESDRHYKLRLYRSRFNMQIARRPLAPFTASQNPDPQQRTREDADQREAARQAEMEHQRRLAQDPQYKADWDARQKARRDQNSARRKAAYEHRRRTMAALLYRIPQAQPDEPDDSDHEDLYDRPPPTLPAVPPRPLFDPKDPKKLEANAKAIELRAANPDDDSDSDDRVFEPFQCSRCLKDKKHCSNYYKPFPCERCIAKGWADSCTMRKDRTNDQRAQELATGINRRSTSFKRSFGAYIPSFYTVLGAGGQIPVELGGSGVRLPPLPPIQGQGNANNAPGGRSAGGPATTVTPPPPMSRKRKQKQPIDYADDEAGEGDDDYVEPAKKRHASGKKADERPNCDQCTTHGRFCDRGQPCSQCVANGVPCNATLQDRPFHNLDPSGNSHLASTQNAEHEDDFGADRDDLDDNLNLDNGNHMPPVIDPNLQPLAQQFGPLNPLPPLNPNQVLVPDSGPTDAQAQGINQHFVNRGDPSLPGIRPQAALERDHAQGLLQRFPASMADENAAQARNNWGSQAYPLPADPNRQAENARDGMQAPIDEDVEMEDVQHDIVLDPDAPCCDKFPAEYLAAVTPADWEVPDVPQGQIPMDMTMDPAKKCREQGTIWWYSKPTIGTANVEWAPDRWRRDHLRRADMCGTRKWKGKAPPTWTKLVKYPAKDCSHVQDDDICSCMRCHQEQDARMRNFHHEERVINNTKKWLCYACKAKLDNMRLNRGGVRNLRFRQCRCIGQLKNNWLCNAHRFNTQKAIERRLSPRFGLKGWADCPTGWCGENGNQGEDDSGAWQCKTCCSVVTMP